jgi:hypothetical protein
MDHALNLVGDRNIVLSAAGHEPPSKVRRLRPLRVLLAMRDRRFMRVTSFLLERRGYEVLQEGSAGIVEAAARSRADVVVFEADASRGSSARIVAALTALPTAPGVVTIGGTGADDRLPGAPALEKWTPVDDLAREIDAASLRRRVPLAQPSSQP